MNRPHIFIIDDDTVQHLILKKRLQSLAPELCISHFDNGKDVINLEKAFKMEYVRLTV